MNAISNDPMRVQYVLLADKWIPVLKGTLQISKAPARGIPFEGPTFQFASEEDGHLISGPLSAILAVDTGWPGDSP